MVDATAAIRSDEATASGDAPASDRGLDFAVSGATESALATYRALAAEGVAAPAQSGEWIGAWIENLKPDCVIAIASDAGRPVFALALEVVKSGPIRLLRFMGDRHANGNFPATSRDWLARLTQADMSALFTKIRQARPDIDLLHFERLAPAIDGAPNPLLQFDHHPSPNLALAVDLDGGFEAVLGRTSAKRKRKKHRSQTRKFEAAGGFRRITAETPEDVDRVLTAFFEMKEQRFRKMGVANVFGDGTVRRFFSDLFKAGLTGDRRFVLHGLEVGGKLRAVTGSSLGGNRIVCEFGAIAEDELSHASPGDFLFFENIREAVDSGQAVYDFSVGDEPYKRLWCDTEITQYDVLAPLSLKGRAYMRWLRALASVKGAIKNNPLIWKLVKRLRKSRAADAPSPAETDD
jgi:CelD/BcsL family acetyltransferase involved in cellulose biosynthesis